METKIKIINENTIEFDIPYTMRQGFYEYNVYTFEKANNEWKDITPYKHELLFIFLGTLLCTIPECFLFRIPIIITIAFFIFAFILIFSGIKLNKYFDHRKIRKILYKIDTEFGGDLNDSRINSLL